MIFISGRPDGHVLRQVAAGDGVEIPLRHWATAAPRGSIVYLHGQGDHSGPFTAMGDLLAEEGFAVYAPDQRGFGLSTARRGDIDSFDRYIGDAARLVRLAAAENGNLPVFLMGLSMGGHIACRTAARLGREVAGLVVMSPGFRLKRTPVLRLVRMLCLRLVLPNSYLPTVVRHDATTRNRAHIEASGRDPLWVTAYTARFYWETLKSVLAARQEMGRIVCPVLMLQAEQENIVCPETARRYFSRISCPEKEFRLLVGWYHNLIAEPEMPDLARDVAAWLRSRSPAAPLSTPHGL